MYRWLAKLKWIFPALYMLGALPIWWFFQKSPPDGLANLPLVLYTAPVAYVGTFLLGLEFPYFPGRYLMAHTLYFAFAVTLISAIIWLVFHGLQRLATPKNLR